MGSRDKFIHYIIGIVTVSNEILATQEHLDGGVFQFAFECAQAIPGIIV